MKNMLFNVIQFTYVDCEEEKSIGVYVNRSERLEMI